MINCLFVYWSIKKTVTNCKSLENSMILNLSFFWLSIKLIFLGDLWGLMSWKGSFVKINAFLDSKLYGPENRELKNIEFSIKLYSGVTLKKLNLQWSFVIFISFD
jgi:hypothetical protein